MRKISAKLLNAACRAKFAHRAVHPECGGSFRRSAGRFHPFRGSFRGPGGRFRARRKLPGTARRFPASRWTLPGASGSFRGSFETFRRPAGSFRRPFSDEDPRRLRSLRGFFGLEDVPFDILIAPLADVQEDPVAAPALGFVEGLVGEEDQLGRGLGQDAPGRRRLRRSGSGGCVAPSCSNGRSSILWRTCSATARASRHFPSTRSTNSSPP